MTIAIPKRACALVLAALVAAASATVARAQSATPPAVPADAAAIKPEPYEKDEFPAWLRKAGRFEIIAIGSFPVMYFYSSVGWDIERWSRNGFDQTYAPWPFKNEFSYRPTESELMRNLVTAGVLSICLATADLVITSIAGR